MSDNNEMINTLVVNSLVTMSDSNDDTGNQNRLTIYQEQREAERRDVELRARKSKAQKRGNWVVFDMVGTYKDSSF